MWKPIAQLTVSDLQRIPVWEWREVNEAEEVRPTEFRELTKYYSGPGYIAATRFVLSNGQVQFGYCSPAEPSGLDYTQPVILTPPGRIPLWNDEDVREDQFVEYAEWLGVDRQSLLPIQVGCEVRVDGNYYREVVNAL
jgi:hypothetical protein